MDTKIKKTIETKRIKLSLNYPENLHSKFANHIVVQHQKEHFTLSFFETLIPPLLGENEEEKKALFNKLESIEARCVAKVIVTPEKLADFIKVMRDNFKNHEELIALDKKNSMGNQ